MNARTFGGRVLALAPGLSAAAALAYLATMAAPATAGPPRNVLVLYAYSPRNVDAPRLNGQGNGDSGLAAAFAARPDVEVALSREFLDREWLGGRDDALVAYLREKYANHPPEVVVAATDVPLVFALRHRAELFPHAPIVHIGVSTEVLQSLAPLPPDVLGSPVTYDFVGTVEQALRWHPGARRLVVVTGASPTDRQWETRLRAEAPRLPPGLAVDFLAGLPADDLLRRLRELPAESIVYSPGFSRDGLQREFTPRDAARLIVDAAPAPVYGPYPSFLGSGIVGGRLASFEASGRFGAATVLALLDGVAPSDLRPPGALPTTLRVDWRQLQRWGIPESALPADAIVNFRPPTMWEAYRPQILIGVSVMVLQAALIAALLFERRRRQRTTDALTRQDEHLRLATEAAGLSPWIFDPIERSGRADDRKPGRGAPERSSVADFHDTMAQMPPQHRAAATTALARARETHGSFEIEYPLEEADGTLRWQAARGRADGTRPERLIGVAVDVTSRKRAELQAEQDRAALQHMTRVSLLGQLSASIAHQLNQPLASIRSNAEAAKTMLDRMPVDVVELREICADIVAEDDRAAQVIRRLGVLFKRGTPLLEPIDLNDVVLDTIELTRGLLAMRHVSVETRLATALPRVPGDRVNLQQVLLNLIVNAADAMADLPNERRRVMIATEARERVVRLCVTDHGPGVPPDAIDAVFEPFWSTRPGGMGMGLAVCRAIVEAHRGTIAVANAADGGAQFIVELPLADS